jgi:FkbM family methyltransferase
MSSRRDELLLRAQAAVRDRLGLDVRRWAPEGVALARRLRIVEDNRVSVVIDAGANHGQFARELRQSGYQGRILSLEPLSTAFAALDAAARTDPLWECHRVAVADADGQAELHVAGNSVSSSLLAMEARHLEAAPASRYVASERVRTARLDALADDFLRDGDRIYLKLDVQGSESKAIEGARGLLAHVVAIETELSLVALYRNQTPFRDMLELLDAVGYDPVSLEPAYADPRNGHVLQVDGIFLRRDI